MFSEERIAAIRAFYETRERWQEIKSYRTLRKTAGSVKNVFYGDSITEGWPLKEFFPNASVLNRGIGGDNVYGLYDRLSEDVIPYSPKRVFMLIGINGIEEEKGTILENVESLALMMKERGIEVFLSSVLPLRSPDSWNRFQYQGKIVEINAELRSWAGRNVAGFLDYHSKLKDSSGQLAAEFAKPDGTHITFKAYCQMAELVKPFLA